MKKINPSKMNKQKIQPKTKVKLEEAELNSVSAGAIAILFSW